MTFLYLNGVKGFQLSKFETSKKNLIYLTKRRVELLNFDGWYLLTSCCAGSIFFSLRIHWLYQTLVCKILLQFQSPGLYIPLTSAAATQSLTEAVRQSLTQASTCLKLKKSREKSYNEEKFSKKKTMYWGPLIILILG